MPVLLIKDVPASVRDMLASQADRQGRSLQSLLLDLVTYGARTQANAGAFDATQSLRVTVPDDLRPDIVIRQHREAEDIQEGGAA